jgi:hypothetical protein
MFLSSKWYGRMVQYGPPVPMITKVTDGNLQLFILEIVDAVQTRGTVWSDCTDGRQSYSNLRT